MAKRTRLPQIAVAAGLILTVGCDWLRPGGPPDEADVEISSEDVSQITAIISQNFARFQEPVCEGDPECPVHIRVISADTLVVSTPYSSTIEFTERHQILIDVFPSDEVEARVHMKVHIDGREWFNNVQLLSPTNEEGGRDILRFMYQYAELQGLNSPGT